MYNRSMSNNKARNTGKIHTPSLAVEERTEDGGEFINLNEYKRKHYELWRSFLDSQEKWLLSMVIISTGTFVLLVIFLAIHPVLVMLF